MKKTLILAVVWISVLAFSLPVFAGSIQYVATDLTGGQWRYDYTVNTSPFDFAAGINGFTIDFDYTLYGALSNPISTSDWLALLPIPQPDPVYSMDGIFDELAQNDLLAGSYNFSVDFTWLGTGSGSPGSQPFNFYTLDAQGNIIDKFNKDYTIPATSVPEPSFLILLGIGLAGVGILRRKSD
jgi:hypothetical protein